MLKLTLEAKFRRFHFSLDSINFVVGFELRELIGLSRLESFVSEDLEVTALRRVRHLPHACLYLLWVPCPFLISFSDAVTWLLLRYEVICCLSLIPSFSSGADSILY